MANLDTKEVSFRWYRDFFKRKLDILISLVAVIALAIPMIIIAICVKKDDPHAKIWFRQERIGEDNRPFVIYKFRTMVDNAPHRMATAEFQNSQMYITKIGKVLRKTSLDELPQLFNVLKGEMSLIGPRPLISKERKVLDLRDQLGANKVLPGITGLAQVHGRDELNDKKKAMFDGQYANQVSFSLDMKIFYKTIFDVLHSRGIHDGNEDN
ncbi:MAG TPA: sugar transferase [Limosilactobacillus oris]|uniref:sugar transferase n=1 Tax=Limosilactobacillus oris TaxID=1632 RepID=UPI001DBEB81B|nr:sugar transferase [Limosilactobacillus oris]HJF48019.1 sugar transferase [Limosilactobacillus oris]